MKVESVDKLKELLVSTYKKIGDKIACVMPLAGAKNIYTGDEVADEIEGETDFGIRIMNGIILLAVDLLKRDKLNLPEVVEEKPNYEYEMFFNSEEEDVVKIDGWIPIATDRIKKPERIDHYIETGLLRRILKQ